MPPPARTQQSKKRCSASFTDCPVRPTAPSALWIVSASLGAGLRGNEMAAAHTSDIENIGDGRLAVRVRGRQPAPGAHPNRLHRPLPGSHRRIRHYPVFTDGCSQRRAHHRLKARTPPVVADGPVQRGYWPTCWQEHPWPCCG